MKKILLTACLGLFMVGCNSNLPTASIRSANTMNVNLAWQSVRGSQLGFYVEESTNGKNFVQILTIPDGINNASVPVISGSTYYFRMRSFNTAGTSNYTPVVTVKL